MEETINTLLSAAVDRGDLKNVSAIVVNRAGTLYEGAFGQAQDGGPAMTTNTVVTIASMTKAITGVAAMQMVERSKFGLDTPAGRILPYLNEVQVVDGTDEDGRPRLRPPASPITLRHLLTHTSGFVYDIWHEGLADTLAQLGMGNAAPGSKAELETPLFFDPGSRWEYGTGVDWAGLMVEAASGETLGDYFAKRITGPLGMADTAFTATPAMAERLAPIHHRQPDGSLALPPEDAPPAMPPNPEYEAGGHGLLSTTHDYARFLRAILRGGELDGKRVLSPLTVGDMARNLIDDVRVTKLKSAMPALSNDAEFFPGDPKGWGLSFQVNLAPGHTGRAAGALMWAGLTNCYYWIDHVSDVAGVFVTQLFPFADEKCLDLYYAMETAVYDALNG